MLKIAMVSSVVFSGLFANEGTVAPLNQEIDLHRVDLVVQVVVQCSTLDQKPTKFGIISYSTLDRYFCGQNLFCYKQQAQAEKEVCQ